MSPAKLTLVLAAARMTSPHPPEIHFSLGLHKTATFKQSTPQKTTAVAAPFPQMAETVLP
jgi:hypothetical protein